MNRHCKALELDKVLALLAEETGCADAADLARELEPASSLFEAKRRMDETDAAYQLMARFGAPSFGQMKNVDNALRRAEAGASLSLRELLDIAETLRVIRSVFDWRRHCEGMETVLDDRFSVLAPNKYLEEKIGPVAFKNMEISFRSFYEKLIPLIINNALHGKKLPVYGDGKNVRDWLYVEDHAKAIDMVQEQGSLFQTYNIGGHNEKQNIEIIHIIIETLQEMLPDSDPRKAHINNDLITYVEDRKGHDRRYAIAPDKIKAEIGWYPETMFKEGIRKTIAWYFEHEDWMNNVTSGDYQKYYNEMYEEK